MAEEHLSTSEERRKIVKQDLSDAINLAHHPVKDFIAILDYQTEGETGQIVRVLKNLLERESQELDKIYEAIHRTLGRLCLEYPIWGKTVQFEGQIYEYGEIIKVVLTPNKPQAPEGGE